MHMQRFTDKTAMQNQINSWKADGLTTAIVPTMGNLHQGHLSLVRTAADHADKVIVSIYINPAQFAAHEDFDTYPRSHDADFSLLEKTGCCDGIYVPDTMYSDSHATMIMPEGAADGLEAEKRPHFFRGVATIVLKLFNHVPADIAIFGEKDFQQLLVIKQMVADLDVPINIIASPTIRDVDGLALSSRNGYLSAEQRAIAPTLYASLQQVRHGIISGTPIEQAIAAGKQQILDGGFDSLDYLGYCNRADLQPLSHYSEQSVLLVAARLGTTRLIDNLSL